MGSFWDFNWLGGAGGLTDTLGMDNAARATAQKQTYGSNPTANAYADQAARYGVNTGNLMFNQGAANAKDYRALGYGANTNAMRFAGDAYDQQGQYQNNAVMDRNYQEQARQAGQQALGRLKDFYQQGPGPSAAQAQLQQASDANMGGAIALAHSGRGAGDNAAAMRNAQFQNAATQQQTAGQMASLRAQEEANWRGQQLQAMGTEQNALSGMRGQDLQSLGQNQNTGLGYGNLSQGFTQLGTNAQLGYNQLTSQQQLGGMQLANQAYGQGMQNQIDVNKAQLGSDTSVATAQANADMQNQREENQKHKDNQGIIGNILGGILGSDARGKTNIAPLSDVFGPLDSSYQRQQADTGPRVDLRPAQGYSYEYKDPGAPGAAPGRHVGPMAQDLERTAAAGAVHTGPDGRKMVDTGRLSMVNTAALSEQQRKIQEQDDAIARLYALLDGGQRQQTADTAPRFGMR